MPYEMKCTGDNCHVYKKGETMPKNKMPMTKDQATKYMAALYANTEGGKKDLSDLELIELETKCGGDYPLYVNKLSQDDPRANYDPRGGLTGAKGCTNCRWYHASAAACDLIYGEIAATGVSDLWLTNEMPAPDNTVEPLPVYIVNPDAEDMGGGMDMGGMKSEVKGDKTLTGSISTGEKARLFDRVLNLLGIKAAARDEATAVEGFKIGSDGRWLGWYSNNAKDRAGEYFAAKATDAYIERVESGAVPYPELWYKHIPTLRMGKADHIARIGYLTFATGTFYDDAIGTAGKAYLEAEQKSGNVKTMSHGYLYPANLKQNGVYGAYNTFEISVLDPGEECNPYTEFEVNTMFNELNTKGVDRIKSIFGEDIAKKLINFGEAKSKQLEAMGVDLKAFNDYSNQPLTDTKAQEGIKLLAEATLEGLKGLGEKIDGLTAKVDGVETANKANADALAALKAFVNDELAHTPRASKSNSAAAQANPAQVELLKKAAAAEGNKTDAPNPTEGLGGTKSLFDIALEAAGVKPTV